MRRTGRPSRPRSARIVWDEANLEYLDAHRTPKQKITEPKTPYHAPEREDGSISPIPGEDRLFLDQAVQAQQICDALRDAASTSSSSNSRSRGGWTSSEDEGEEKDNDSKGSHSVSFKEHRKAHYDEYHKLKSLRHQPLDDEDAQPVEETTPQESNDLVMQPGGASSINHGGINDKSV